MDKNLCHKITKKLFPDFEKTSRLLTRLNQTLDKKPEIELSQYLTFYKHLAKLHDEYDNAKVKAEGYEAHTGFLGHGYGLWQKTRILKTNFYFSLEGYEESCFPKNGIFKVFWEPEPILGIFSKQIGNSLLLEIPYRKRRSGKVFERCLKYHILDICGTNWLMYLYNDFQEYQHKTNINFVLKPCRPSKEYLQKLDKEVEKISFDAFKK